MNQEPAHHDPADLRECKTLAALLRDRRDDILQRWKECVRELPSAEDLPEPLLQNEVGRLILELASHLEKAASADERRAHAREEIEAAAIHGVERLRVGFDIKEVVQEYNWLRRLIFRSAEGEVHFEAPLISFVNEVIDRAIAAALESYVRQSSMEEHRRRSEHLAFVTHEMRNPLATIGAATEILRSGKGEPPPRLAEMLQRSVERMDGMIRNLIEESRQMHGVLLGASRPMWVDVYPLAESIVTQLDAPAAQAGIELRSEVPEPLIAHVDPYLLDIVLANLVRNAIDHSGANNVVVGARRLDHMLECWVQDDGRGIPPDRLKVIFEPYETRNAAGEGRGVGLYIARRFTEAMHGTLRARNIGPDGTGARFELELPTRPPTDRDANRVQQQGR